jgi:uncharacterized protein
MIDNQALNRFEREEQGALVFALYRREPGRLIIRHVEAAPLLRGTGAADRLMREIVEWVQQEGDTIIPLCGYAARWLRLYAPSLLAD